MEQFSDSSLGKTDIVTDTDKLGQVARFLDLDRSGSGVKSQLSQMPIFARLVINNSGGNLTAGTIVTADATYGPGRGAGAAAVAGTSVGCGVVDPWVSGNIANGSTFWMIEEGPCKFKFTTGTSITIGMVLALVMISIGALGVAKARKPDLVVDCEQLRTDEFAKSQEFLIADLETQVDRLEAEVLRRAV